MNSALNVIKYTIASLTHGNAIELEMTKRVLGGATTVTENCMFECVDNDPFFTNEVTMMKCLKSYDPGVCVCNEPADQMYCVCNEEERTLRAYIYKFPMPPMTPEMREECLEEIGAVEGYDRKDYEASPDASLAHGVLDAWLDYCRDKGLL